MYSESAGGRNPGAAGRNPSAGGRNPGAAGRNPGAAGRHLARAANLLGALALEAARLQQTVHEPVGETGAAATALVTIGAYPDRTIEQLRAPIGLSQPGAVRLVDRLVASGWVERGGSRGRRGFELRLTEAGEAVVDELLARRRAVLAQLLEPLSARERDTLEGLLEKMLAARTGGRGDLERLCRLCERRVCERCPVAAAQT